MLIHFIAIKIRSTEKFLVNIYRSVNGILKVIILSKFNNKLPKAISESCIVLGNGPSLRDTITLHKEILKSKPLVSVNNFVTTTEFKDLKPVYHVMLDPAYFVHKQRPDIIVTFEALRNNVSWNMTLFIPYLYRQDPDVIRFIKEHTYITIQFYNYTISKGFDFLTFALYKKNLAMPQFYNVLGVAIFLALNMKYKKIWVVGADHSWFKNIEVDENNTICQRDHHFYDKELPPLKPVIDTFSGKQTMSNFFLALHKVFDSYLILNRYAKSLKTKIYNASEFSLIDMFERKKLEQ